MRYHLQDDARLEEVDGEVLMLDRGGACLHRVTGETASALRLAAGGIDESDLPAHLTAPMESLLSMGLVTTVGWSRRKLLLAGGVGVATAGITTFALASPASAQSCAGVGPCVELTTGAPATQLSAGTIVFCGTYSVIFYAYGGGGGGGLGGFDTPDLGGGGGGGGGVRALSTKVTGCTQKFTLDIGAAGMGGPPSTSGGDTTVTLVGTGVIAFAQRGFSANFNNNGAGGQAGSDFNGGNGANGSTTSGGGGGGGAGAAASASVGSGSMGGAGGAGVNGAPAGGTGGDGATGASTGGDGSGGPGAGGGGGGPTTGTGGNGTAGAVWVYRTA